MARPFQISDARILEAARSVFLEKGIRATTAEVAKRARVAEGLLFKRFRTKDNLFFKAMVDESGPIPFLTTLTANVGVGDLRLTLEKAALEAIAFFRQLMPLIIMSWSTHVTVGGLPPHLAEPDPRPIRALRTLTGVFAAEMDLGRLARRNPEVLARIFIGCMQHFVFFELLVEKHHPQPMTAEHYVRELIEWLWSGAAPPARKRRPRSRRKTS